MSRSEQEQVLDWIHNHTESIALFIEPIGKGEFLDNNRLKAYKKVYYDNLFKEKGIEIKKEGRFIWNEVEEEFEHYSSNDLNKNTVQYNRTYFWIVA